MMIPAGASRTRRRRQQQQKSHRQQQHQQLLNNPKRRTTPKTKPPEHITQKRALSLCVWNGLLACLLAVGVGVWLAVRAGEWQAPAQIRSSIASNPASSSSSSFSDSLSVCRSFFSLSLSLSIRRSPMHAWPALPGWPAGRPSARGEAAVAAVLGFVHCAVVERPETKRDRQFVCIFYFGGQITKCYCRKEMKNNGH